MLPPGYHTGINITSDHKNVETHKTKYKYRTRLLIDENVDTVPLQETHTEYMKELTTRGNISAFELLSAINNHTH